MGSWRALGIKEGLVGLLLPGLAEETRGKVTGARGASDALWGRENPGAPRGSPDLHTCGTGFHETDEDE